MLASGRENKAARQLMVGTDDQWLYTVLHIYHAGVRSVTFWYFCGVKEHPHNTSGSCRRISELCQTVFEFFFRKKQQSRWRGKGYNTTFTITAITITSHVVHQYMSASKHFTRAKPLQLIFLLRLPPTQVTHSHFCCTKFHIKIQKVLGL